MIDSSKIPQIQRIISHFSDKLDKKNYLSGYNLINGEFARINYDTGENRHNISTDEKGNCIIRIGVFEKHIPLYYHIKSGCYYIFHEKNIDLEGVTLKKISLFQWLKLNFFFS